MKNGRLIRPAGAWRLLVAALRCVATAGMVWAAVWAGAAPLPPAPQYRALWVDAFHEGFKTPSQTEALVRHARRYNYNALMIEVRKAGDAYYASRHEPVADDLAPGYDPLRHVISLCHGTGRGQPRLEVHAWMVVYRVGRDDAVTPKTHILKRHPDWICRDQRGHTKEEKNLYLDPGVPGVIDYTAAIAQDIATQYDVDGIHLDYVRYPDAAWGYNPIAVKRFQQIQGARATPAPGDAAWSQFRRDQITALVRRVYAAIKTVKPLCRVSVAGIAYDAPQADFSKSAPFVRVFQDWRGWLEEGIVDAVFVMNYKRELESAQRRDFRAWNAVAAKAAAGRHVVIGQAAYLQAPALTITQLRDALATPGVSGIAVYSYATPASRPADQPAFWEAARARLFAAPAAIPRAAWLERPSTGALAGRVLRLKGSSTVPMDGVAVEVIGSVRRTLRADGGGYYLFFNLPPGAYTIRASGGASSAEVITGRVVRQDISVSAP